MENIQNNIIGMRCGLLTVIDQAIGNSNSRARYWLCRCECGREKVVNETHLKSGHTKSCGCLSRKHPDYVSGMKIGKLTLLQEAEKKSNKRFWLCRCDCGNTCVVMGDHIKSGHTKSCGCLHTEIVSKNQFKRADITGKRFGRLVALRPTDQRNDTSIVWQCICDCGEMVFCDVESLNRGHTRSCGCLLREQRKQNMAEYIHFVDGTCIEKIAKQKETSANTSGHRGVWMRKNKKWRAGLQFRGKRHNLGTYDTFEEAVAARLKGEEMIGEYLQEYYSSCSDDPSTQKSE